MIKAIEQTAELQAHDAGTGTGADVFRSSFWISPRGKLADLGGSAHINAIVKHPAKFGLTRDEIDQKYDKYGEPLDMEGKARETLILGVLKKGFVRIRLYPNRYWSVSLQEHMLKGADYSPCPDLVFVGSVMDFDDQR